ncbi:TFIIB-type zinc ribbon-containing protein [Saccharothrix algeriensis]|uniref:Zf-TFIIB domain-containing protein n=2 Tax=Saccharothrix algeriensis TaxID=173560 RepID=A0A8T8HT58_9PSEU|nr:zf-TFIIB domain-containing protein [Saccharothrix algeriensis]QTR01370.1 zf-TFIIB domain-containing protein [Saccharothrix algeriensis]
MQCPKCHANMRTFDRMGVHIEQCDGCRGVFLDYGELEAITRLEQQMAPPPPPPPVAPAPAQVHYVQPAPQPGWGYGGGHYGHRKHRGLGGLFFSS